jgi:hypothetical protein
MNYLLDAIWTWKAARPKIREEWGLGALTDEQLAESLELMLQGLSYKKESARLKEEYGVVISPSSLQQFYSELSPFILTARRAAAIKSADSLGEDIRKEPRNLEPQILDLIQQTAFELLSNPAAATNIKSVKTLVGAVLKIRDQNANERRITLLEKQASEAQETLSNSKLSATEQAARLREIFKK